MLIKVFILLHYINTHTKHNKMKNLRRTSITIDEAVEIKEAILEAYTFISFNYIRGTFENTFNRAITFHEVVILAAYLIKKGVDVRDNI